VTLNDQLFALVTRIGDGCLVSELSDYENKLSGLLERQGRVTTTRTGTDWFIEPVTESRHKPKGLRYIVPDECPF
jgi:hypothetical protein